MKKIFRGAISTILMISVCVIFCSCDNPPSSEVKDFENLTYTNITSTSSDLNAAIENAESNLVIKLASGEYSLPKLMIEKPITIVGLGKESTIINVEDGDVVINSRDIKFCGLAINCKRDFIVEENSNNFTLFHCQISSKENSKINIRTKNNFTIYENTLSCALDIILPDFASLAMLKNNKITTDEKYAIKIYSDYEYINPENIYKNQMLVDVKDKDKTADVLICDLSGNELNKYYHDQ